MDKKKIKVDILTIVYKNIEEGIVADDIILGDIVDEIVEYILKLECPEKIKEKYFPGLIKEEKRRIKEGLCPNCGQPMPKKYLTEI